MAAQAYTWEKAWRVLSRLAGLALRHRAVIETRGYTGYPGNTSGYYPARNARVPDRDREERAVTFTVFLTDGESAREAFDESVDDEFELAERQSVQWAERAARHQKPRPPFDYDKKFAPECPTCGAHQSAPCTPIHDGERDPGDWAHPARDASWQAEHRPHPQAVRRAREVLLGERPHLFEGLSRSIQETLLVLATSVIAYARQDVALRRSGDALLDRLLGELKGVPSHTDVRGGIPRAAAGRDLFLTEYIARLDPALAEGGDLDEIAVLVETRQPGETDAELAARVRRDLRVRRGIPSI